MSGVLSADSEPKSRALVLWRHAFWACLHCFCAVFSTALRRFASRHCEEERRAPSSEAASRKRCCFSFVTFRVLVACHCEEERRAPSSEAEICHFEEVQSMLRTYVAEVNQGIGQAHNYLDCFVPRNDAKREWGRSPVMCVALLLRRFAFASLCAASLSVIDSLRIVESAICEEERRSIRLHNKQDACFALQMLIFNAFGLQIRMNWTGSCIASSISQFTKLVPQCQLFFP